LKEVKKNSLVRKSLNSKKQPANAKEKIYKNFLFNLIIKISLFFVFYLKEIIKIN